MCVCVCVYVCMCVWYVIHSKTLYVKERVRQTEFGRNTTLNSPHILMSAHSLIQQAMDGIWVWSRVVGGLEGWGVEQ